MNEIEKKKIYMKAKRRGMLELDLSLGYIADNYLNTMTLPQILIFDQMLDVSDETLFKWLMGYEQHPPLYNFVFTLIKNKKNNLIA